MKPLLIALQGKGLRNVIKRVVSIFRRYGITSKKMDQALGYFVEVLSQYSSGASFPITAIVLARNPGVIEKYQAQNIEFAVHGYNHVDHTILSKNHQISSFTKARKLFGKRGVKSSGFRAPYLRFKESTLQAVSESGFIYDSSSSLNWDVLGGLETDSYRKALEFYGALSADKYPALPKIIDGIVEFPYCLPDDESLVERLSFGNKEEMAQPWLEMLRLTYERGELFTLGLHPERIHFCEDPLRKVLEEARKQNPKIWIARLDEIATWWLYRSKSKPLILTHDINEYIVKINRKYGIMVLGRNLQLLTSSKQWVGNDQILLGNSIKFKSSVRPFIGISDNSSPLLKSFLTQNGYIVENARTNDPYSIILNYTNFPAEEEKPLLEKLENLDRPVFRFGVWPNECKSALCVTGDIDALTVGDYLLRALRS
jgi:peptidoglycan/xylan/chitin deacetylase (PgdA/CDA1 family)